MIEAAPDHEAVGDFEAAEIDGHLDDAAHGAVKERTDTERARAAAGQRLQEITRGETGIDDVFDQQYIFVSNGLIEIFGDTDQAGRGAARGAAEAGDRQEVNLNRYSEGAGERGEEKDGALEYGYQLKIASAIFFADFSGDFADAGGDLLFREQDPLDILRGRIHDEATIRKPYLKTRSWKSFW